jgi:sugar phosphate isomerase/epimerase
MKLGISQACYRWVVYPHMRRDRAEFLSSGLRLPYLQTLEPPSPDDPVEDWLLERVEALGVESLYVAGRTFPHRVAANRFRTKAATAGITFVGNVSFNIAASKDEWEAGEFSAALGQIWRCSWGGATVAAAVHNQAERHNHFTKDPPVGAQLDRAVANFRSLIPACAEHGIVLAWENHIDYRLAEIVQVVEEVDSPWLRINLDTANPIAVIEDPLAGAGLAAKYAVNMHLKDMRIQPATGTGEPRVTWAPLGRGHVPIAEILDLVQEEADDPVNMPVCIEVAPPPDHDPDVWVRASIDWLRSERGHLFESA